MNYNDWESGLRFRGVSDNVTKDGYISTFTGIQIYDDFYIGNGSVFTGGEGQITVSIPDKKELTSVANSMIDSMREHNKSYFLLRNKHEPEYISMLFPFEFYNYYIRVVDENVNHSIIMVKRKKDNKDIVGMAASQYIIENNSIRVYETHYGDKK